MLCCVGWLVCFKSLALPNLFDFSFKKFYLCCIHDKWQQKKKAAACKDSFWKYFKKQSPHNHIMQERFIFWHGITHWSYYFNLFFLGPWSQMSRTSKEHKNMKNCSVPVAILPCHSSLCHHCSSSSLYTSPFNWFPWHPLNKDVSIYLFYPEINFCMMLKYLHAAPLYYAVEDPTQ